MTELHGNPPETQRLIDALGRWWNDQTATEIEQVVPKAVEYGPNSMVVVGQAMARLNGREVSDEEAVELACMLYVYGKLGRWLDAAAEGKRPSDDTIYDIGIYIKMAQRARDVGGWPFGPDDKEN